jgi:hypothetical protein
MHGIALALIRTCRLSPPQAPKQIPIIISCAGPSRKTWQAIEFGPNHFFSRDSSDCRTNCLTFALQFASGTLSAAVSAAW